MSHEPKRRGRPTLDPTGRPSERVQVNLIAADYRAAARLAATRRESLQDLIRRSLERELERKLAE
jgi:hypothetical protein